MAIPSKPYIRINQNDNVAIATGANGLAAGYQLENGLKVKRTIPMGHKVALTDIEKGEAVYRYGVPIGYARENLEAGEWINESKMALIQPPDLDALPFPDQHQAFVLPLEGYTFEGYRNPDGSVGTKNVLAVASSVQCVAGLAEHLAARIRQDLLPRYPNVDGVVALNHAYGCGIAMDTPLAEIPIHTLQNILKNPNFGNQAENSSSKP
jgi:galactarate dehydratase